MCKWTPEVHEKKIKEMFDKLVSMGKVDRQSFDAFKSGYDAGFDIGNQIGFVEGYFETKDT